MAVDKRGRLVNTTQPAIGAAALVAAVLLCMLLAAIAFLVLVVKPWLRAFLHGTPVSLIHVVGMRLRGTPPSIVIDAYIQLHRAGLRPSIVELESCYVDSRIRITNSWDLVDVFSRDENERLSYRNHS
jgi:uncharacterized protein YqfA (UPF0365 family)